jgi:uncharacterized membrane protein YjdF
MARRLIAIAASLAIIGMAVFATKPTYHAAPFFLIPAIWGVFLFRRKLKLTAPIFAFFCSAILLHMLGAFGWYQQSPLPFSFDILVHFYFPLVIALAVYGALAGNFPIRHFHALVITFFIIMGLGAMHEIMEYGSYLLLGEETGMLKPTTGYFFDTQRDLTSNLAGLLVALGAIHIRHRASSTR